MNKPVFRGTIQPVAEGGALCRIPPGVGCWRNRYFYPSAGGDTPSRDRIRTSFERDLRPKFTPPPSTSPRPLKCQIHTVCRLPGILLRRFFDGFFFRLRLVFRSE